jgi:hypothetical protein
MTTAVAMSERIKPDDGSEDGGDWMFGDFRCDHIAIVSISPTECQCMDCLRIWPKEPGFKSDWPQFDRG